MLRAISTAHDAGVGIYGDYNDLESLHETIHHLCDHPNVAGHLGEFALGFAYDVRKSFEGARETKLFGTGRERVKYFGVKILWPFYLVQVGLLRGFAKIQPTSAIHHSQLYLLEHVTEKALAEKNPETARFCREWLNHFPGLTRDFISLFIEEETYKFVFKTRPKRRLQALPGFLRSFHWFSDEYRAFEKEVRTEAKKQGCPPQSLGLKRDWPDFKW
ncbi:MAG TPA: hypothetical protein VKY92_00010 [Verrucomicrobiae bacterium]|nr:hypothetical protein [Verrucomicrobiae bacterium]